MNRGFFDEINKFTPKRKSWFFGKKGPNFSGDERKFKVGEDTGLNSNSNELKLGEQDKFWNGLAFITVLLVFFFVFLAKSYNLQIIHGGENLSLAEGNRVRIKNVMAERGLILDRNGEVLVRNRPAFSLEMDTTLCDQLKKSCTNEVESFLADFNLDTNFSRVEEDIKSRKEIVVVASNLSKEEILPIEARLAEYPLFSISVAPQRDYILPQATSHLIGYVGFANTLQPAIEGKMGVEASYNSHLSGIDGGEIIQVNSSGKTVSVLSKKDTVPGDNLNLYVDKGLQDLSYKLLKEKVEDSSATAGAIVAQDPQTGGILSLVSYPSFDANEISGGLSEQKFKTLVENSNKPFFNRVISATYPPASTFKMIMASAVLMEDVVSPNYQINDKGYIQVGSFIFRNWVLTGHGLVDLRRAIQVSNDTYFYTVGGGYGDVEGLGIDNIYKWAKKFGIGRLTRIDIPGEEKGFMPDGDYKDWYLGDTYITSIGQGDVLSTPLQINNVTAYFANGGKLNIPKVVKKDDRKNEVLAQDLIDQQSYDIVRQGLKLAVEPGGTGYPFFDFEDVYGVSVAGKTGTAEFGGTNSDKTHAWFTVFGPYEDAEIALTVFLESGGGGSDDAAPIARELFDYWFEDVQEER